MLSFFPTCFVFVSLSSASTGATPTPVVERDTSDHSSGKTSAVAVPNAIQHIDIYNPYAYDGYYDNLDSFTNYIMTATQYYGSHDNSDTDNGYNYGSSDAYDSYSYGSADAYDSYSYDSSDAYLVLSEISFLATATQYYSAIESAYGDSASILLSEISYLATATDYYSALGINGDADDTKPTASIASNFKSISRSTSTSPVMSRSTSTSTSTSSSGSSSGSTTGSTTTSHTSYTAVNPTGTSASAIRNAASTIGNSISFYTAVASAVFITATIAIFA